MATAQIGEDRFVPLATEILDGFQGPAFGGSDVVSVSQTGHIEATDYVGQASRRYRLRQTPNVVCSCPPTANR